MGANSNWGGRRAGAGRPRSLRPDGAADREFIDRVAFVRDLAVAASKTLSAEVPKDWTLHAREIQACMDGVVSLLGSALDNDARPFADADFEQWRARRGATG